MTMPLKIARAISANDYLRGSDTTFAGRQGYKEWLHYTVSGDGIDALVNFSIVDDLRPGAVHHATIARLTCLVRDQKWYGDIDEFDLTEVSAPKGRLRMTFGDNIAAFLDGRFVIRARMRRQPIELDIEMRPLVFPCQISNIDVKDGPPIHWLAVPRLLASGHVTVDGRRHTLADSPAYHDHNWGHFRWGRNFAWEWGYAIPEEPDDPWSMVFVRLSDRGHLSDLMRVVFLFRAGEQVRVFRDADVAVTHEGLLHALRPFKLPHVMGLISPGTASDVPARFLVEARGGGDKVIIDFRPHDVGQVIIPNDDDQGVTVINEASGLLRLEGSVGGDRVQITTRSIFEFLSA